jgi:hypothetical protein
MKTVVPPVPTLIELGKIPFENICKFVKVFKAFFNATFEDKYASEIDAFGRISGLLNVFVAVNVFDLERFALNDEEPAIAIQLPLKYKVKFAPLTNATDDGVPPMFIS